MITQVLEHEDMIGAVVAEIPGSELERRRHELGMSQRELAAAAKVSERTVQTAERGQVSDRSYLRIVRALDDAEAHARAESQPELATVTFTIDGPDGPVSVTVTASRKSVAKIDPMALIRDVLNEDA